MPKLVQRRRNASGRFVGRRSTRRRSRPTRARMRRRTARGMPKRDANGRFTRKRRIVARPRRRIVARPRSRVASRPRRVRRYQRLASLGIVREASDKSVAGPALVRRRWWRVDGPVDPSLPEGYALPR